MNWSSISLFAAGFVCGGFLALGWAAWCTGGALPNILLCLETLAARRKPKANIPGLTGPAPDNDLVHRQSEVNLP